MGTRLFVGNLSFDTSEETLHSRFAADGRRVLRVRVMTDRDTGRPRGFAFVDMASVEDAAAAIAALDGSEVDGRRLCVNEAMEREAVGGERRGPPREDRPPRDDRPPRPAPQRDDDAPPAPMREGRGRPVDRAADERGGPRRGPPRRGEGRGRRDERGHGDRDFGERGPGRRGGRRPPPDDDFDDDDDDWT